nr:integrase, catalytic region, zinc finger, CCHC-type, peptidase aspartic, catalytic [Tanacetum cinerariifolium]
MYTIEMTMQQVQVNTKFLNALPPEWSKFVTDVKLAKSLYTTNYDQLGIATTSRGNYAVGQAKVVKCYNCLGEGHMAKQYTQPKRLRNSVWFKEKLMLAEAQKLDVQEMPYSKQTNIDDFPDNEMTSDSNIIPYSQYLIENELRELKGKNVVDTVVSKPIATIALGMFKLDI